MGIGGVLPGVSGGILAISLGVYEKMMLAIGNLFRSFKENVRYLFPLVIGGGIGILLTVSSHCVQPVGMISQNAMKVSGSEINSGMVSNLPNR